MLEIPKRWTRFFAVRSKPAQTRWLNNVRTRAQSIFERGLKSGPHNGRLYTRRGGVHRASAAGEYPASDTGALLASLRTRGGADEIAIGTNRPYSVYLRQGTSKMARRRMSDNALREAREEVQGERTRGIVRWIKQNR